MTPAKTERFELRLDEETLERVDDWRRGQEDLPSRSEAVRRLVDRGLTRSRSSGEAIRFSDGEKLIISMLCDLQKHLKVDPDRFTDPDFVLEALCNGHFWALKWEMTGLFHDRVDDEEQVHFVARVMAMWDMLERSYANLSDENKERVQKEAEPFGKDPQFNGFDGNNEGQYMGIAMFLVNKMDRFQEFKGRELNSHSPRVGSYRRMLAAYQPMTGEELMGLRGLDADQVIQLLRAIPDPRWKKP
jgi:uncharacterized protein YfbU (UPF0304 family)